VSVCWSFSSASGYSSDDGAVFSTYRGYDTKLKAAAELGLWTVLMPQIDRDALAKTNLPPVVGPPSTFVEGRSQPLCKPVAVNHLNLVGLKNMEDLLNNAIEPPHGGASVPVQPRVGSHSDE
jgi:hypothetical protein